SASSASRSSGWSSIDCRAARPPCPPSPASRPPRARPTTSTRSTATRAPADDGPVDGHAVAVNLVLVDDAALGGVVGALSGLGSQILFLQKSEPSLEDVFVELLGRGFRDSA